MTPRSPAVVSEKDAVLKPAEKDVAAEAADAAAPAYMSMVDPFLVEALQNPRHRVTGQYCSGIKIVINFLLLNFASNLNWCLYALFIWLCWI